MKDGGPAFPDDRSQVGMSLRDYFAIHCDQPGEAEILLEAGLQRGKNFRVSIGEGVGVKELTFGEWWDTVTQSRRFELYARVRFKMADAMLAEREK